MLKENHRLCAEERRSGVINEVDPLLIKTSTAPTWFTTQSSDYETSSMQFIGLHLLNLQQQIHTTT